MSSIPAEARRPGTSESSVLCLHCSSGSARQWQLLASRLSDARRVVTPDLLGYGVNPPWRSSGNLCLADEVRALGPALASADAPVDVVAHSFGAAVALKLALDRPGAVRSLCLYEPVLFALLRDQGAATRALAEVFMVAGGVEDALARGDRRSAARRFTDFWSGRGAWKSMPKPRRDRVIARIDKVLADFEAVIRDDTSRARLRSLNVPVLLLSGGRSPAAVQRICDVLAGTLPHARQTRLATAGHMGPVTHAREVNAHVAAFLEDVAEEAVRSDSAPFPNRFSARAA